jgi:hypothetical protein
MKVMSLVLGIVVAMVNVSGTVSPITTVRDAPEVLGAPSYLPAEERFVHIAGGFFSYFDRKPGSLVNTTGRIAGTLCIELDGLRRKSRFVYLAAGFITLRDKRGDPQRFTMKCLDYVRLPGSSVAAYRLTGEGVTLVATDSGREAPSLAGELYVQTSDGYECYTVSIRGRSENEAERHLWERIERITRS